jgi:hypothetical protein
MWSGLFRGEVKGSGVAVSFWAFRKVNSDNFPNFMELGVAALVENGIHHETKNQMNILGGNKFKPPCGN